jgi:hypothetical protein
MEEPTRRYVTAALVVVMALAAAALFAALATAPAASARSSDHGASFAVKCGFSHRSKDDPIVHPGERDAAHSHDFFGNRSTDAFSTYESLLTTEKDPTTTCLRPEDKAAYWFPTVSWNDGQGIKELTPDRAVFYYRAGGKDHRKVKPYPAALKVIAANGRYISWMCGQKDTAKGSRTPPRQCDTGTLGVRVIFPDCVAVARDGEPLLDSDNHRSHIAYSRVRDGKRRCPRSYSLSVPQLTINANFTIGTDEGEVTLSCDEGDCGPSTMHADFFNAWDQTELDRLVEVCINDVPYRKPRPPECQSSFVPPPPP